MWKRVTSLSLAAALILGLGGCSNMTRHEQRVLSGGALGSAAGLGIAALTGGSLLVGGLVGAAGGAAIGAVTK
jgi:osmotically inducible lipoprotein OsmB